MRNPTGWSKDLRVTADGEDVVAMVGVMGLRILADRTGLTSGLSDILIEPGFRTPASADAPLRPPARGLVPRELPADTPTVVGRDKELGCIIDAVAPDGDGVPRFVAVHGQGVIGKSALAIRAATRLAKGLSTGRSMWTCAMRTDMVTGLQRRCSVRCCERWASQATRCPPARRRRRRATGRSSPTGAVVAACAAVGLLAGWMRTRFVVVTVEGTSMEPTFGHGDRVLARRSGPPRVRTGDVVVLGPARLSNGDVTEADGTQILDLLLRLQSERAMTVLIATHEQQVASRCDRLIRLTDGQIVEDVRRDRTATATDSSTLR